MTQSLHAALASRFAATALGHVTREYPNHIMHVLTGPQDARTPRDMHPIFFGSFDWHSCVHGWWTLFTLYRLHPDMAEASAMRGVSSCAAPGTRLAPVARKTATLAGSGRIAEPD